MNIFQLLIVEDDEQEIATCRDTISRYKDEKQREVELVACKDVEEAFSMLDNSIDGAIIDLKLGEQGDEGNQVIRKIEESHFRIPVVILTATPGAADTDCANIGIFKKGDPGTGYAELFDKFWDIHNTGLTRIMGGRGVIECNLNRVFLKNLLPHREIWIKYGKSNPPKTEKALLRHTLNHLLQLLDDDEDRCYPEEVYLRPPLKEEIRIGSLVKEQNNDKWFAVMSPACDLVVRKTEKRNTDIMSPACDLVVRKTEKRNTDRILIVEVDSGKKLFPWIQDKNLSNTKKDKLKQAFRNNKSTYYHWLPKTEFFKGGFLNFRKLVTLEIEKFDEKFEMPPKIQISPSFVKDIVARFSSYYARQGQPDIDFDKFIDP